ncbi:hypothetical protein RCL_jg4704.t1 [Rhizophagus clarus]|uniref:Uncharacterized protein n=1 Tax=Rhizophagus clarus TaxID=94130 RepID=A0A8H3L9C9_9GLOM|nr:hypothetical protein RCL_jg4704.t1 [Rhizophagus clarus]
MDFGEFSSGLGVLNFDCWFFKVFGHVENLTSGHWTCEVREMIWVSIVALELPEWALVLGLWKHQDGFGIGILETSKCFLGSGYWNAKMYIVDFGLGMYWKRLNCFCWILSDSGFDWTLDDSIRHIGIRLEAQ